ncbi:MAG TPA: hypothetical protein VFI66_00925 [Gemmatimonadales bacterium]|nr:hypothetical protein [Gemmatimonadales bacterium]
MALLVLVTGGWQSGGADSVGVLRSARRAQERFETTRRANLPERDGGWSGGSSQIIGRMRIWYESDAEAETAPAEPPRIRQARAKLLAALDTAGTALPGDEWIVGQRVRYLLEDGQADAAARVAAECRAVAWWCHALDGLVRHTTGDFAGADSSFAAALAGMPEDERCRWNDISALLEGEVAGRYRRLDCASREQVEQRWWWLARPLYSLAANDRRTEHFARRTMARIHEGRRTLYGLYWEDDFRDMMLRYGWPRFWTRTPPVSPLVPADAQVTGHDSAPAFDFAPSSRALQDPGAAKAEDWILDAANAREYYAPSYATRFGSLEHQAALFRRGDSCVVVAAPDLADDTLFADRPVTTALALAADERVVALARDSGLARGVRALTATAPCGPMIMSLEAMAPRERHAARARYGITRPRPDGHPALSDLLLFDPPDSLPTTLEQAFPRALGSTRIVAARTLGVFWELYGVEPAQGAVAVSLTMTRQGTGWLRRAAESVGLASPRRDVQLRWEEVPEVPLVAPRSLAIDVSGLSAGRYVIEVSVTPASGETVTARREVQLAR